jgi:emp24/gp25L/p24 family/GOLD.
MKKIFLVLALLLVQSSLTFSLEFSFDIRRGREVCFAEFLAENVLVVGEVEPNANFEAFEGHIKNERDETIVELANNTIYKFSFTAFNEGNYKFCFSNYGIGMTRVRLNLKIGVEAKDYSDAIQKESLNEVELTVKRIKEALKNIKLDAHSSAIYEDAISTSIDNISSQLILFSLLTIGTVCILAYVYISYMKRFFRTKKLI